MIVGFDRKTEEIWVIEGRNGKPWLAMDFFTKMIQIGHDLYYICGQEPLTISVLKHAASKLGRPKKGFKLNFLEKNELHKQW